MVDYMRRKVVKTDKEILKALPENMRIDSEEELVAFLKKREKHDNGVRHASKQMKDIISEKFDVTIKLP